MAVGPALAGILGGMTASMIVGDALGAVPVTTSDASAAPSISGAASAGPVKTTATGTPVAAGAQLSARSITYLAAGYVVVALIILACGSRFFRNARVD